jgi:hypothetical protein
VWHPILNQPRLCRVACLLEDIATEQIGTLDVLDRVREHNPDILAFPLAVQRADRQAFDDTMTVLRPVIARDAVELARCCARVLQQKLVMRA